MASPDPLSLALSVLSKSKETPLYTSDAWKQALDESAAQLGANRTATNADLATYLSGINKARTQIEPLVQQDIGTLGGQINRLNAYDPFSSLKQTGDYLTGLFNQASNNIAGYNNRYVNLARAGTYGGKDVGPGADSSYLTSLISNNVSRNLAPAWANVINQINPLYQSQQQDRAMTLAQLQQMINERANAPLKTAQLALLPIQARQNALMGELAAGGSAADALRKLYRGSKVEKNWAGKLLDQTNASYDSALNAFTSLAGDYMGGGAAKGGGTPNPAVPNNSTGGTNTSLYQSQFEGTAPGNYGQTQPSPWVTAPPPTFEGSTYYGAQPQQAMIPPQYNPSIWGPGV